MELRGLTPPGCDMHLSGCSGQSHKGLVSSERCSSICQRDLTSGLVLCQSSSTNWRRDPSLTTDSQKFDKKDIEKTWREFFSDPSQWWDNRSQKVPRYPDFKHKKTKASLWVNGNWTPPWVAAKLAAMAPGAVPVDTFTWNSQLSRHLQAGEYQKTLELFEQMQQEGIRPNNQSLFPVLKACSRLRALEHGRRIHMQIIETGCESDVFVGSCLVDMYAKCGSLEDAYSVFNKMSRHDAAAWNAMILGHAKGGQGQKAFELYGRMQAEGVTPNSVTFLGLLTASASLGALEEGKRVHQQIIESGWESEIFVKNSLINMYAKCGSIEDAWEIFSKMPWRDAVAWNTMILGYVRCGQGRKALDLFRLMLGEGVKPKSVTFTGLLNACASAAALEEGRFVHEQIIRYNCESDIYVANSLVDMYAKCGSIEEAQRVFNKMRTPNVVSWSALIVGHAKCGEGEKALQLFHQMEREGVDPDRVTFLGVLIACANSRALEQGRRVHHLITERGYESDVFVGSCLVDMYAKCGSILDAWRAFKDMPVRNIVSWNAMILGFVKCGEGQKALELFGKLEQEGLDQDPVTFVGVLNACASVGALEMGRYVHKQIMERGFETNIFVGNALVDMYAKCWSLDEAWRAFESIPEHDVVSWNALILGSLNCGQGQKALDFARRMEQDGLYPDPVTFVGMLNACASISSLTEGRRVHERIIESGCQSDIYVGNSLVDMYAKCGSIEEAQRVFNMLPTRNVVSWNAIIQGCVKCGEGQKALEIYRQMEQEGVSPDLVTFTGVVNACASVAAVEEGRRIHEQIIRRGFDSNNFVGSCLIDMYSKCGSIEDARKVFNKLPMHDAVSWTAMLGAYAVHGLAEEAVGHFERMCQEKVEINAVTFVSLLSACSRGGLVDEGLQYFESMRSAFDISPTKEHYACIVDLLGRAGRLREAEDLFNEMQCEADATVWTSLLSACRIHGEVEIAERIAKRVLELDPGNAVDYKVLLSNTKVAVQS